MRIETRVEIMEAAKRLLPMMPNICLVAATLALLTSMLTLVAVFLAAGDQQTVSAVSESGSVFTIQLVKHK